MTDRKLFGRDWGFKNLNVLDYSPMKKVTKQQILGQQGANLVEKIVLQMGHIWRPVNIFDTGVDGEIEIRDESTGGVSNTIIKAQVKAGDSYFKNEDDNSFSFNVDKDDLEYWLKGNVPVILIVSKPEKELAYWVSLREYCKLNPNIYTQNKIIFQKNKTQFNKNSKDYLFNYALPPENGVYFPPQKRNEQIYTNIYKIVSKPSKLYFAKTDLRDKEEVWAIASKEPSKDKLTGEWFLKSGSIFSLLNLRNPVFANICDQGTVESISIEEWASSDDDVIKKDFVRLLKLAFKELCWKKRFRYNKEYDCYYFHPLEKHLRDRGFYKFNYKSFKNNSSCLFFNSYGSKDDTKILYYYRHLAFKVEFTSISSEWYVIINPTYIFTYDGKKLSRKIDEYLAKIKRAEGNSNVVRYVRAIGQYLNKSSKNDLFNNEESILLEPLSEFNFAYGINDKLWYESDEEQPPMSDEEKVQLEIFQ